MNGNIKYDPQQKLRDLMNKDGALQKKGNTAVEPFDVKYEGQNPEDSSKIKKDEKIQKQPKTSKPTKTAKHRSFLINQRLRRLPKNVQEKELKNMVEPKTRTKEKVEVQKFHKAFAISLGLIALFSFLLFIPILGPVMELSLVPYLACNRGCRYVDRKNGLQVGLLIGIIWSTIVVYIMLQLLDVVSLAVTEPGIKTIEDSIIIITIFTCNILFCMLGGYTGGAKFELRTQDVQDPSENEQDSENINRSTQT